MKRQERSLLNKQERKSVQQRKENNIIFSLFYLLQLPSPSLCRAAPRALLPVPPPLQRSAGVLVPPKPPPQRKSKCFWTGLYWSLNSQLTALLKNIMKKIQTIFSHITKKKKKENAMQMISLKSPLFFLHLSSALPRDTNPPQEPRAHTQRAVNTRSL